MKRLYYLTDSLDLARQVSRQLHRVPGFTHWHFHALAKDEAGLVRHRLQAASPLQDRDVLLAGEVGALLGAALGGVAVGLIAGFAKSVGFWGGLALIAGATLLGVWGGSLLGLFRENYKIRRFQGEIESGMILLMIDVRRGDEARVRSVLAHIPVCPVGESASLLAPLTAVSG